MNLCSIDLSKAFDKVNLHALYIKLMRRSIPVELLQTLEQWLNNCWTCMKWNSVMFFLFKINFGVRQGSILSPNLLAIYLDGIVDRLSLKNKFFVIFYADDILLVAPSICEIHKRYNT
jgi:Reverse transcriptase (RNA-dependent DNA polymerase)